MKIRIITAQTLREKYRKEMEQAPVHRGDWTDYWNFGCASTAKATRVSRRAKKHLTYVGNSGMLYRGRRCTL